MNPSNIIIAIPVYNEEKYLNIVINRVQKFTDNIVIINDGSTDNTSQLLKSYKNITVLEHKVNSGYGRSLITAMNYAKEMNFEWIITMDCDLQHEPEALPSFYESINNNQHDIISGSRYLSDNPTVYVPNSRAEINKAITELLKSSINLELTDSFCGFKAYRIDFIKRMNLTIDGYDFPLHLWIKTARLSGRVTEIPVKIIYDDITRSFGEMLDDPEKRFLYYVNTLNKELINNGYKKIKNIKSPVGRRRNIHIS